LKTDEAGTHAKIAGAHPAARPSFPRRFAYHVWSELTIADAQRVRFTWPGRTSASVLGARLRREKESEIRYGDVRARRPRGGSPCHTTNRTAAWSSVGRTRATWQSPAA
jgi:hypothetical protein